MEDAAACLAQIIVARPHELSDYPTVIILYLPSHCQARHPE
jgi:hypothetical protein